MSRLSYIYKMQGPTLATSITTTNRTKTGWQLSRRTKNSKNISKMELLRNIRSWVPKRFPYKSAGEVYKYPDPRVIGFHRIGLDAVCKHEPYMPHRSRKMFTLTIDGSTQMWSNHSISRSRSWENPSVFHISVATKAQEILHELRLVHGKQLPGAQGDMIQFYQWCV